MSSNRRVLAVLTIVAMLSGMGRMGGMGIQAREHVHGVASERSCAEMVEDLRAEVARMQQALQEMTARATQAEKARDLLVRPTLVRTCQDRRIDRIAHLKISLGLHGFLDAPRSLRKQCKCRRLRA